MDKAMITFLIKDLTKVEEDCRRLNRSSRR
ncbi:hypothetical protein JL09_g5540 [Pichia kudriavzevii]|uniref:Uncharacterized protein n=1 Tax=Pichia kudriavzevii TaxID=4909 RepID=A0A099NRX3_PICKU|nr:hypothetical protein JL09_g5540 [Pichia kudriavzevii]